MILVLADDLTGALEAGAVMSGSGITSVVAFGRGTNRAVQGLVIDTETRHETPATAARRVEAVCAASGPARLRLVYKKTDSTLRGNIGAEFSALLSTWPGRKVFYAPAYPKLGRTVRAGRLYIDGVPVHETAFARDPLDPVTESDVAAILARQWSAARDSVVIFDGAADTDLRIAAGIVLGSPCPALAAGPTALLGCLAEAMDVPRSPIPERPRLPRCLVVNGSLHEVSLQQAVLASARGLFGSGWRLFQPPTALGGDGRGRAERLGRLVREALRPDESLIVFGGDTAFGIVQAFGLPDLAPIGEVLPGVPVSRFSWQGREICLVSKAGGFGQPDVLPRLHRMLAE